MKVGLQSLVKFGKLRPQDLVEKPLWRPDHDRVAPLPLIAVGLQAIASAQRKKQMARPLIRHRELHLNRRILPAEFASTSPATFQRGFASVPFAARPCPSDQSLEIT